MQVEEEPPEQKEEVKKYKVKPIRELKSTFEQHQEEKSQQELHALLAKRQEAERQKEVRVKGLELTGYDTCMFGCV